jgi:DNA-binding transcriptional ArsR family regulator
MSYGKERPDLAAGGWAALAEWTGGLPPEQIAALAAVRPFEAVHSLLRGLAGRNPRELLARAAVLEALASQPASESLDETLSWLAEPARGETLSALRHAGWLEDAPANTEETEETGQTAVLTAAGRQVWGVLRRAAFPEAGPVPLLPAGITPEQIVRALLTRDLEELAAAGREALVPVLPAPPLLSTGAVARAAEALTLAGAGPGKPGSRLGHKPGGGRRP